MGINPVDALRMTFREVSIYTIGFNDRSREEWRQRVAVSHMNARLQRIKPEEFPKLETLLADEVKLETPQEKDARIWDTMKMFAKPGEITFLKPSKKHPKV